MGKPAGSAVVPGPRLARTQHKGFVTGCRPHSKSDVEPDRRTPTVKSVVVVGDDDDPDPLPGSLRRVESSESPHPYS